MPFLEWCITRLLVTTLPTWLFWLLLALLLTLFGSTLAREKNLFVPFFKEVQAISEMLHNLPLYKNIANLAVLVLFWPHFMALFGPKTAKKAKQSFSDFEASHAISKMVHHLLLCNNFANLAFLAIFWLFFGPFLANFWLFLGSFLAFKQPKIQIKACKSLRLCMLCPKKLPSLNCL